MSPSQGRPRHLRRRFLAPCHRHPKSRTTQPCSAQALSSVTTPRVAPAPAPGGKAPLECDSVLPSMAASSAQGFSHTHARCPALTSRPGDRAWRPGHPQTHLCVYVGHLQAGGKVARVPQKGSASRGPGTETRGAKFFPPSFGDSPFTDAKTEARCRAGSGVTQEV